MTVYYITLLLVLLFSVSVSQHIQQIDCKGRVQYDFLGKMGIVLCCVFLILVSGLRWSVGTDFWSYWAGYEDRKFKWLSSLMEFNEPGINLIAKVGSVFYDNPISMFFLASLITVSLYVITIKKYSKNFCFSIIFYMFIGSWHGAFNGVRQYLAAAILFAGHRFIFEHKFFKFLLVVLLAMAFHRTAIIMLPAYFIANKDLSIRNIAVVMLVVLGIRFSYDNLFAIMSFFKGSDTSQYAYMLSAVNPLRIAVTFAPLCIVLLGKKTRIFKEKETEFYAMMIVLNAAFAYATANSAYLARSTIYTEIYAALAYPKLIYCFKDSSRKLVIILICIMYFIYWIYALNASGVSKYQWCFGNI